jgi:hypothetical protein
MSPSTFAALRTQALSKSMRARATQAIEAVAAVAVFCAIGVILAWRG